MKRISIFLLLIGLSLSQVGCGGKYAKGNYIQEVSQAVNNLIAQDSVEVLKAVNTPAKTTFAIKSVSDTDCFGQALIETLKLSGYAISSDSSLKILDMADADAIALKYVVDYVEVPLSADTESGFDTSGADLELIRVVIYIGKEITLTRAYRKSGSSIEPMGNWAYGRWING